ncbi:hypothetical protein D3C71_1635040 [compost metagenome]
MTEHLLVQLAAVRNHNNLLSRPNHRFFRLDLLHRPIGYSELQINSIAAQEGFVHMYFCKKIDRMISNQRIDRLIQHTAGDHQRHITFMSYLH